MRLCRAREPYGIDKLCALPTRLNGARDQARRALAKPSREGTADFVKLAQGKRSRERAFGLIEFGFYNYVRASKGAS